VLAEAGDSATLAHESKDFIRAIEHGSLDELMDVAQQLTLSGHGRVVTYSRNVFIPLTQLCRDVCRYCTFAKTPRSLASPYLSIEQCTDIARAGAAAGCKEAFFTLGDQRNYAIRRPGGHSAQWAIPTPSIMLPQQRTRHTNRQDCCRT
jgi:2-iminoacetate synthase ThiH